MKKINTLIFGLILATSTLTLPVFAMKKVTTLEKLFISSNFKLITKKIIIEKEKSAKTKTYLAMNPYPSLLAILDSMKNNEDDILPKKLIEEKKVEIANKIKYRHQLVKKIKKSL